MPRTPFRLRRHRSGYLLLETVGGLLLVAALATVLAIAVGRQNQAQQKLSDSRAAVRLAERTLTELQTGGTAPAPDPDTTIRIQPLDGPTLAQQKWVEVQVTVRGQKTSLIGLAPTESIGKGGKP